MIIAHEIPLPRRQRSFSKLRQDGTNTPYLVRTIGFIAKKEVIIMSLSKLSKEIISKREECKLTQFELSEILGCDVRSIYRYESMDEKELNYYVKLYLKLENFLGKSLMEIFNKEI